MPVDQTITLSDALNAKVIARWGSVLAWKQWVRAATKADIYNAAVNAAQVQARALVASAEAAAAAQRDSL